MFCNNETYWVVVRQLHYTTHACLQSMLQTNISSMSLISYSVKTDIRVVVFNIPQPLD